MDKPDDLLHEAKKLRLLAAALELQHYTSAAANLMPVPGGDRVIVVGTPAEVARLLEVTQPKEPTLRQSKLLSLGGQMANVMYNLAQRAGKPLHAQDCKTMDQLRREWDDATRGLNRPEGGRND